MEISHRINSKMVKETDEEIFCDIRTCNNKIWLIREIFFM